MRGKEGLRGAYLSWEREREKMVNRVMWWGLSGCGGDALEGRVLPPVNFPGQLCPSLSL